MDLSKSKYYVQWSGDAKPDEYLRSTCYKFISGNPQHTDKVVITGEVDKVSKLSTSTDNKGSSESLSLEPSDTILDLSMDDTIINILSQLLTDPKIKPKVRKTLMLYLYSNGFLTNNFNRITLPYDIPASKTDPTPLRDYIEMDIIDHAKELAEMMNQLNDDYPGLSDELNGINLLVNTETSNYKNAVKRYTKDINTQNEILVKIEMTRKKYFTRVRGGSPCKSFIEKYNLGPYSTIYTNNLNSVKAILKNCIKDDSYYLLNSDYYSISIKS